jgi:hypothetical protein
LQICAFRVHILVTEKEVRQFSPELVTSVEDFLRVARQPLDVVDEFGP